MFEKEIEKLGLTANEAKVYTALLKLGSSLAGEITKNTGIHRRSVYDSIERLMEKGLVSFVIINNRKYFEATDPSRFLTILNEKIESLERSKKEFRPLIAKLNELRKLQPKQDVRFFKGTEGFKTVYEDILNTKKNYVGYGPGEQIEKVLKHYFHHFVKERINSKIRMKLIYNENSRGKKFTKNPFSEIRYLPEEFSSHAALRIYGNKAAILLFSEEEPIAIVIENKAIADGYRKYFDVMWNSAKK